MTKNEIKLLEKVSTILDREGFRGIYDGDDTKVFTSAKRELDDAIDKAKSHLESDEVMPA
jgi:hypothetical protein